MLTLERRVTLDNHRTEIQTALVAPLWPSWDLQLLLGLFVAIACFFPSPNDLCRQVAVTFNHMTFPPFMTISQPRGL